MNSLKIGGGNLIYTSILVLNEMYIPLFLLFYVHKDLLSRLMERNLFQGRILICWKRKEFVMNI